MFLNTKLVKTYISVVTSFLQLSLIQNYNDLKFSVFRVQAISMKNVSLFLLLNS